MRTRLLGFTLIELLVSIGLILTVTVIAITATTQMLHMTRRLQALQSMDATASTLFNKLSGEIASMHPCTAVWLHSDATNHSVELVFMHAINTPGDNRADLLWSRWHWSSGARLLTAAVNRPARWSAILANQARNYWQISTGSKMSGTLWAAGSDSGISYYNSFLSVPQPLRALPSPPTVGAVSGALDANNWLSGEASDFGDYADLLRQARPLLEECTALRLELIDRNGNVQAADGVAALAWSVTGSHIDGRGQPDLDQRPSLLRISFTLTEPLTALNRSRTLVSRTYSFSCPTPGVPGY